MIVGVGVDLIEVTRIRHIIEDPRIGPRFRGRVYTEAEIRYCENKGRAKYESYAGRFAAKEAVMKAMGSGWGKRVGWQDIEVVRAPGGRPEIALRDKASVLAGRLAIVRLSLSITHTEHHAMAYVIAEGE
jgi:holo-[acyl-carrier protein] synthase